jgi:hypothetical protein
MKYYYGQVTFNAQATFVLPSLQRDELVIQETNNGDGQVLTMKPAAGLGASSGGWRARSSATNTALGSFFVESWNGSGWVTTFSLSSTLIQYNGNTVWHAGNDGATSGLDADLLDGLQGSAYGVLSASNNWSGAVNTFTGAVIVGNVGGGSDTSMIIAGDAGQLRDLIWRTGSARRWVGRANGVLESGSNVGSDFQFYAVLDNGSTAQVYGISRATQVWTFVQSPILPTPTAGDNSTKGATTAYARQAAPNASYRTILDSSCSHTAAKATGTYGMGQGDPAAVSGTGTLYPLNLIYIDSADFPSVDGLAAKLRVRAVLATNDVAPGATFVIGLHPVTRPNPSGGAGLVIYTIGAAIAGSTVTYTTPAADGPATPQQASADFALPANGLYVLGFVQSVGALAASSHVHMSAQLQQRNA